MRWYIKKAARMAVAVGSWATGYPARGQGSAETVRVRALTYHRIGRSLRDPFCVDTADFDAQMRLLSEQGLAISIEQLTAFVAGRAELPSGACLVTIDDGMLSTLTEALPVLQRWQVPAVAYVSSSLIGRSFEGLPERYLTSDELRGLADTNLVSVGSHAHSHRSLGLLPLDQAREELIRSREQLQQMIGREVASFAYPFGTRTDFNDQTDRLAFEAGYSVVFNSMHGAIRQGMHGISLPRVKVEGGEPTFMFPMIVRGRMDAWRAVDSNLWRLQRVRTEIA